MDTYIYIQSVLIIIKNIGQYKDSSGNSPRIMILRLKDHLNRAKVEAKTKKIQRKVKTIRKNGKYQTETINFIYTRQRQTQKRIFLSESLFSLIFVAAQCEL